MSDAIIKPTIYDAFSCIADCCPFTCCQQWKIAVDDDTDQTWKKTAVPDGVKEAGKNLHTFTKKKDGGRVIRLNREHLCPFLNEQKLCRLVLTYGDEMLSKTCATFPREIYEADGVTEYSLDTGCPAVLDALREAPFQVCSDTEGAKVDALRRWFMDLMQSECFSVEKALLMIFYLALDLQEKGIDEKTVESYRESDIVSELSRTIDGMSFDREATLEERNELFLDFAENYRKEGMYQNFLEPLAIRAEEQEETGMDDTDWTGFWNDWTKYLPLFRNLLASEIYSQCHLKEGDLTDVLVRLQWIAMEYAVLQHGMYLKWQKNRGFSYEELREAIVIVMRMAGFDEEGIYEYMENSFQELIWEWGYLALIIYSKENNTR